MTQAEELWGAAAAVGAASRPLPLFYCLSQAGRAICAAWLREGTWRPTAHGISSRVTDQGEDVISYGVKVAGDDGMYSRIAAATDSNTFAGTARVADLWLSLPDLPRPQGFELPSPGRIELEAIHLGNEVEKPLEMFSRLLSPRHARIAFSVDQPVMQVLEEVAADETKLSRVTDLLAAYPSAAGAVAEIHTMTRAFGDERVIVLTFPDEKGELRPLSTVGERGRVRTGLASGSAERFVLRPRIGTGDESPPSQLLALWALVYAFSQLARYEPEVWVDALNPDTSTVAVDLESVLDSALELVPELLVPAVTNGLMPRLLREASEQKTSEGAEAEAEQAPKPAAGEDTVA
jgi:hypothetical protein